MNKSQQPKTIERLVLSGHNRNFLDHAVMFKGKCPLLEIVNLESTGKTKLYEVKKVTLSEKYGPSSVVDISEVNNPGKGSEVVRVEIHKPNMIKEPGTFSASFVKVFAE